MNTRTFSSFRLTRAAVVTLALISCGSFAGCQSEREVTRVDPKATIDLDYRFNDVDARQIYQEMVDDALFRNWSTRFMEEHNGKKPVVIVGRIENRTNDYIESDLFTTQWERELLNSDRVRFVARPYQRGDLRDERAQGQEWNSPETRKQMRNETGADYMLLGTINSSDQRSLSGRQRVKYYQVTLELIDIESNEKVWIGTSEIKKLVRNP